MLANFVQGFLLTLLGVAGFAVGRAIEPNKKLGSVGAYVETLSYGLLTFGIGYGALLRLGLWSPAVGWTLIIGCTFLFFRPGALRGSFRITAPWIIAVVVSLAPFFVHAYWSARGPFPEYFFFIDNAWHLNLVHSLLEYQIYPPISIADQGYQVHYHNLHALLAAFFSSLTGVTPHFALFGLVFILAMAYFLAATTRLLVVLGVRRGLILPVAVVVICFGMIENPFPTPDLRDLRSLETFRGMTHYHFTLPLQSLANQFIDDPFYGYNQIVEPPFMISASAILGFALCFDLVARTVSRNYLASPIIYVLLFAVFAVAKATFAVSIGLGVAFFSLSTFLLQKTKADLIIPALAGLASMIVFFWLGPGGVFVTPPLIAEHTASAQYGGWSIGFPSPLLAIESRMELYLSTLLIYCALIMIFRFAEVGTRERQSKTLLTNSNDLTLIFFVLPFLAAFFAIFGIYGFVQFVTPAVYLGFVILLVIVIRISELRRGFLKTAAVIPVVSLLLLTCFVSLYYSVRTSLNPGTGVDAVSNESLASVLEPIPLSGSKLITNDIRFPAVNPDRRFLGNAYTLSAIFGHQGFNLDKYAPIRKGWIARDKGVAVELTELIKDQLHIQDLLTAANWPLEQIQRLYEKYGFTHLIIRRDFPHAEHIPLKKIFENTEYSAYEF